MTIRRPLHLYPCTAGCKRVAMSLSVSFASWLPLFALSPVSLVSRNRRPLFQLRPTSPTLQSHQFSLDEDLRNAGSATCRLGPKVDASVWNEIDVNELHERFKERGWVHIPSLLDVETCGRMLKESRQLLSSDVAFRSHEEHTVYQEEIDAHFPREHPRNAPQQSSKTIADFDRLGQNSPLRQIYNNPALLSLVQAIVSPDQQLYLSACPYNSAYYNLYDDGDGLGWHFDKGEFGVNLLLQNPSSGGTFEFHPNTRSSSDPWAFEAVRRLLAGDMQGVDAATDAAAGSLIIFAGRMSLHRVSPVLGSTPRINAILHYEREPGRRLGAYSLKRFFGRELEDGA